MPTPVSAWRDAPAWLVRCPRHGVLYRGPLFARALQAAGGIRARVRGALLPHGSKVREQVARVNGHSVMCDKARLYWQGQLVHGGANGTA